MRTLTNARRTCLAILNVAIWVWNSSKFETWIRSLTVMSIECELIAMTKNSLLQDFNITIYVRPHFPHYLQNDNWLLWIYVRMTLTNFTKKKEKPHKHHLRSTRRGNTLLFSYQWHDLTESWSSFNTLSGSLLIVSITINKWRECRKSRKPREKKIYIYSQWMDAYAFTLIHIIWSPSSQLRTGW